MKFHVSDILRYSFEVSEVHLIDIACRLCDGFGETAVVAAPLKEAVRGRAAGGVAAFSLGGRRHLLCLEDLGGIGSQDCSDCSAVQALKLLPGLVDVFKALAFWEMWQPGAKMRQRIFSIFSPVSLIIIVSCRSMTSFASFMQMFNVLSF